MPARRIDERQELIPIGAPRRSRCHAAFHYGLLGLAVLVAGCTTPEEAAPGAAPPSTDTQAASAVAFGHGNAM